MQSFIACLVFFVEFLILHVEMIEALNDVYIFIVFEKIGFSSGKTERWHADYLDPV